MNDINLIPAPQRMARARRRRIKAWSIAVVAAVIILCIPIVFDQYRRVEAARLTTQKDKLVQAVSSLRQQLATLTDASDRSNLQLQRAKALRSKRAWSALISTIAKRMPEGCWLTSIVTDPSSPTGGGVSRRRPTLNTASSTAEAVTAIEAPRRLKLVGYASNASEPHEFVKNIKMANAFSRVSLKNSTRQDMGDVSYYRFELECEW